ncbi:MAG TPA: D-amino acid dehydrogenase [Burkholderiaceae bacterium]|nr:D-amino acid dehydrogenase [Burkholderiaceae bacterium]
MLVLGAGVIGVTCGWFLREAGHQVTVVERQPGAARETSFANGGQISVSHSEPWANPAAPRKILKWLGREDAPLLFRPRLDATQWLWGMAFLRECLPTRTAHNTRKLVALALYSRSLLKQLRAQLSLDYGVVERGILHFYTDAVDFEVARESAALMRTLGCDRRSVSTDEAIALEPALVSTRDRIVGADYCAEDESGDAHAYTVQLAERCAQHGVEFLFDTTVQRALVEEGRCEGVEVSRADGSIATLKADAVVACLGAGTRPLLAPLGIRLQIVPAKGYSATFDVIDPARAPSVSLTDDEHKLVFSRFGRRLRVAGTVELGGAGLDLSPTRCDALTRRTRALFPGACDFSRPRYWAGLRPLTPSNVPYLGASRIQGLHLNTGHGTLGWTLAAGSGQLIADLVSGRPTAVPLPPIVA